MRTALSRQGVVAFIASSAAVVCACTTAEQQAARSPTETRQCFLASQVNGFYALDNDTVHVFVGANRAYELDILGTCPAIDWSQRIGIRSTGGSSWVCRGLEAELFVPSAAGGLDRCPVLGVRALTREEARAARRSR